MNIHGRRVEEKLWETKLRHNLFTNYAQDPDLHVLLFISGDETNSIIREALRDWMVKTNSMALDPEFRAEVFLKASMEAARGGRPVGSEILAAMGHQVKPKTSLARAAHAPGAQSQPPRPPRARTVSKATPAHSEAPAPAQASAPPQPQAESRAHPSPAPVDVVRSTATQASSTPVSADSGHEAPPSQSLDEPAFIAPVFDDEDEAGTPNTSTQSKAKDRWLERHKKGA